MAIERDEDLLEFQCDGKPRCREAEAFDAEDHDFHSALAEVKRLGWLITKSGDNWIHLCPVHRQKFNDQLQTNLRKGL